MEDGIPLLTGTTGILSVSRGGTGQDLSTVAQNTIPYFSSTGTFGNIGIGTTGYYLAAGSPPVWTVLPIDAKIIKISNATLSIASGSSTTSTSTTLSSSGDWAGKNFMFVGEMCEDVTVCVGSTTNANQTFYSGSTSTFTGPFIYGETDGGSHTTKRSFISYGTTYPSVNSGWGSGNAGSATCSITVSSGNLIFTASRSGDGASGNTAMNCEVSGVIIRQP